ncbi:MAG: site-specific integrase [Pirellula sp.]|nr:site-specific integrase [Pirellula sp.]
MHDAVDWKIIDENPFSKVRTQRSTIKVNEFVPREVVDKLMKKANPVWKVILGLSRYGGLRTPSETLSLRWEHIDWEMNRMSIPEPKVEHHEGRGIRSCPIFPELRPILDEAFEIFGDKSEYVVAAPQYRAAANTAMGWKNSNLRTEMTRLLRRAGVSGWPRLFHSVKLQGGGPADKQNCSVSFHCTWSALGLVIHHGSHSRVTCWSPRMILPRRSAWRR